MSPLEEKEVPSLSKDHLGYPLLSRDISPTPPPAAPSVPALPAPLSVHTTSQTHGCCRSCRCIHSTPLFVLVQDRKKWKVTPPDGDTSPPGASGDTDDLMGATGGVGATAMQATSTLSLPMGKPSLRRIKGRIHRSKSLDSIDLLDANVLRQEHSLFFLKLSEADMSAERTGAAHDYI
uniref:Uncharacterized protein n=1 Tax=Knipowitschia caucasica TaxID=637954 RepID=A0AAV2LT03_KNICA